MLLLSALLTVTSSGVLLAQEEKTIVGAWLFSSDNNPTAKDVALYHRDGTVLHIAGGPTPDGSYQNPAGGAWRHGAGRSYDATAIYTIYSPGISTMVRMIKATAQWTLSADGDHFSGQVHVEVMLPDGTVIASRDATASATRIVAEQLP